MTITYKNICSLLVCIVIISSSAFGATIFVNANATISGNDGQSWTTAYLELSDALSTASVGDQIWVAKGSYYPTSGTDRAISFIIPNGVSVLGGFPNSGNPILANRDPLTNITILSGDIDKDGTLENNSYSVIYTKDVNAATVLDGFTISDGNANGGVPTDFPVTLENGGAAWYNEASNFINSNPTIKNCIFENNYASNRGGALFHKASNSANANYVIENTLFQNNTAANDGGAIYNSHSGAGSTCNPMITNTVFQYNRAEKSGGAIFNNGTFFGETSGNYLNCDFIGNIATANEGAAVFNDAFFQGNTSPTFTNCNFIENNANPGSGGAIYSVASSSGVANFKIINCLFDRNVSNIYGGAICNIANNNGEIKPTYANCTFKENTSVNGGATYSRAESGSEINATVVNCIFYDNSGGVAGTIYQNTSGTGSIGNTTVSNCIFQENTAGFSPIFHLTGSPTIQVNNSLFDAIDCADIVRGEIGNEAVCSGGNIYNQDPEFVNPAAGDFHLMTTSPAINAGNNGSLPTYLTTDSDGETRIMGGIVDMGIYEAVDTSTNNDLDNDGILNASDNCPLVANPLQEDIDLDGIGSVCDCDDSIATGTSCSSGCSTFYADVDNDGFGNPSTSVITCDAPPNYVANNQDFNDNDNTLYPNAPELCDGKDNNNNGQIDEGTDDDNDGVCNENDICSGGDDNIDLNTNGIPDACESTLSINCLSDIIVSASAGQNSAIVTWSAPTASTDCMETTTEDSSCTGETIPGFIYKGSFENHNYYLSTEAKMWTDAAAIASANGGNLVAINSQEENDFIKDIIGGNIILIGLTDNQTEGEYKWENGDTLIYNNLADNPGDKDYGLMYFWNGEWAMSGNYSKIYVLEKPCDGGGEVNVSGLMVQKTAGPDSGTSFPIGTTPITYTATDSCGATATCTFNVTVEATASNITINCPSDIIVSAAPGTQSANVTWITPTPNSTCTTGTPSVSASHISGSLFNLGTTTVTYTASDNCGGTTSCSFDITVNEGTSFVNLICPNNIVLDADPGANTKVVTYQTPIGNTTCATPGVSLSLINGLASGAAFPIGTTIVEYQGTDACNTTDICSFSVTINPTNSSISLNCPPNIMENISSPTETIAVSWAAPTGNSDCTSGGYNFTQTAGPTSGSQFGLGTSTISYTATDNCGGSISCSFNIIIEQSNNNGNLAFDCPSDINISIPQGTSSGIATWSIPTATTDCIIEEVDGGSGTCSGSPIPGFEYLGEYNGSDYYISESNAPWVTAQANCVAAGGNLVGIEDEAENDYINSIVNGKIVHIGLTDQDEEGTYIWINGESTNYLNLSGSNASDVDYTVFYPWNGEWGRVKNNVWKLYLMEIKCGGNGSGNSNSIPTITQTAGPSSGDSFPVGSTTISYRAEDDCDNIINCSFTVTVTESAQTCTPDTDGGQINGNEIICDAYDPQTINSNSLPSGGAGTIEYVWLKSETGCPDNISQAISNSNSPTYNPPLITTTTYYVRWSRRASCTDWVASNCITKTVDDCSTSTSYCESSADQPWQEWISKVELADLSNPSSKSIGYKDYSNLVANLTIGQTYTVSVNLTFSYNQWDEGVYVWMDFNQDNDFNDPGELVMDKISLSNGYGGPQPSAITQSFTVPAGTAIGTTKMRVAMKRELGVDPCDEFVHGEVEDYTLNIQPAALSRSNPVLAFEAYALTGNSILEWFSNTTDLESNFEIERSIDNESFSKIEEVEVNYLNSYESTYKIIDEQPQVGANYYRIKQVFKNGKTSYTETKKIVYARAETKFRMYPNPANEYLNIEVENVENKSGNILITNMLGQIMKTVSIENGMFDTQISTEELQNGMHTLIINMEGTPIQTELFIVEHMK